ncbi:PLP dependent protein [Candidatus Planktophila sulfonica]|uniref:Pyridoxal phosphate homeostasis protein n=1 Tax=Candidatus Planktophila sulfonica TaxID=1884904 RepID=A0A249KGH0_9ACTN|nr:YggS family pyridoxal phosphate-dependent enzyme [Candidatus Planktophila sulfonica]ASY15836.1 PLP dependent protein [Candidatus Planktophila sulfonica]
MRRRGELATNLEAVKARIKNPEVTLIVVTKTYPVSDVQILHELGVRDFGENRNEEGLEKSAAVEGRWHYQGEIQSRKLRDIGAWADVVHSLDNASHISKLANVASKSLDIFLQLSLDGDPARGGAVESELPALADIALASANLHLAGLMCVPPVAADPRTAFTEIAAIHQRFISKYPEAKSLSAGMSGDFEIAIDCGATHIRVGSSILGSRTVR